MQYDADKLKARIVFPFILVFIILCLIGVIFVFEIKQTTAMKELSNELATNTGITRDLFEQGRRRDLNIKRLEEEVLTGKK